MTSGSDPAPPPPGEEPPLDDFLSTSRRCGELMGVLLRSYGVASVEDLGDALPHLLAGSSVGWGLPPKATLAAERNFLEGVESSLSGARVGGLPRR